jgi:hypothetical protein
MVGNAPANRPHCHSGIFSRLQRFMARSGLPANRLGAISSSRVLHDNRTTSSVCWPHLVGSAILLLSRYSRCSSASKCYFSRSSRSWSSGGYQNFSEQGPDRRPSAAFFPAKFPEFIFLRPGALESLAANSRRPVALVHTQYLEIKYKKPTLVCVPTLFADDVIK